jgi:hypothetical protein
MGGAAIVGGALSAKGAKDAAKAQQSASDSASANSLAAQQMAIDEQRRQYDTTRQDFAPFRDIGYGATNQLARLYGIQMPAYGSYRPQPAAPTQSQNNLVRPPMDTGPGFRGGVQRGAENAVNSAREQLGSAEQWFAERGLAPDGYAMPDEGYSAPAVTGGPDMSVFFNSPDYNFRREEGQRDIGNSFAARGGAFSGNALRALTEYNSNLAAGEYGNFFNRLAGLANIGQGGTAQTAHAGANMANNITSTIGNTANQVGNNLMQAGNARASGIQGRYNALGDGLGFAGGIGASYLQNRNAPTWRGWNSMMGIR